MWEIKQKNSFIQPRWLSYGIFPELCQVRSMLENKLKFSPEWIETTVENRFFFVFFLMMGHVFGVNMLGWDGFGHLGFFNFGVCLPLLPPFKHFSIFYSSSGLRYLGVNFQMLNLQQHGLPAVSWYHCQRPHRKSCCFEGESLTLYRCIWCYRGADCN